MQEKMIQEFSQFFKAGHNFKYTLIQILQSSLHNFIRRNYFPLNQNFLYLCYIAYEKIFKYTQEEVCVCVLAHVCVRVFVHKQRMLQPVKRSVYIGTIHIFQGKGQCKQRNSGDSITKLILNLQVTNDFHQELHNMDVLQSMYFTKKKRNFKWMFFGRRKYQNTFLQRCPSGTSECFVTIN